MKIHYKGLIHDRFGDAPWVGTLWIAPDCKRNCKGCFNQHLLDSPTLEDTSEDIVNIIIDNPLSEGIILAGLDPLTYKNELIDLIDTSLSHGLKVMLYTALPDRETLLGVVPEMSNYQDRGILVKYGEYDESRRVHDYIDHDVLLATSNQYIEEL